MLIYTGTKAKYVGQSIKRKLVTYESNVKI